MTYSPWKFVRATAGAFSVVVHVNNIGPATVTLARVDLTRNGKNEVTAITPTAVGSVFLKKSGKGVIQVAAADVPTDGYFVGHCHVLHAPSPADSWSWALGIQQNNQMCGIIPTQSPTTGQKISPFGILDPADGGYEFGGQPAGESTISFDIV